VNPAAPVVGTNTELFGHDGSGRLTHAENDFSQVDISYDSLGRAMREESILMGASLTLTREFDSLGNRSRLSYPSGRTVRFGYDVASQLRFIDDEQRGVPNVGVPGSGVRRQLDRTFVGKRRRTDVFRSGVATRREYDAIGRNEEIRHDDAAGGPMLKLTCTFDAAGNRVQELQAGTRAIFAAQRYGYDGANRLTEMGPVGNPSRVYVYDAGSNRLSETGAGIAPSIFAADMLDRLVGPIYDPNGNPQTIRNLSCFYDQANRLCRALNAIGQQVFAATYDAIGRRISIDEGVMHSRFVYDGVSEIAEYENGHLLSERIVSAPPDDCLLLSTGGHEYVINQDWIGSTRMLSNEIGQVVSRYEYEPYGRENTVFTGPSCRHRFMGRESDDSIGLYHFRARHYDTETARFLQRDPIEAAPFSGYRAFGSNPLTYTDPFGTSPLGHTGEVQAQLEIVSGSQKRPLGNKVLNSIATLMYYTPDDGGPDYTKAPSFELDDPTLSKRLDIYTPKSYVREWLRLYTEQITLVEGYFHVDRRAIAGAIAWEALENPLPFSIRAVGPGKVHVSDDAVLKQVEDLGYLLGPTHRTKGEREDFLRDPINSIVTIGAILAAGSDAAAGANINIRNNPGVLANFYQSANLDNWASRVSEIADQSRAFHVEKGSMGAWVHNHLGYIESAVGQADPKALERPFFLR
jgi:RHS repeat-associated protein